jgi:hypothetical protein
MQSTAFKDSLSYPPRSPVAASSVRNGVRPRVINIVGLLSQLLANVLNLVSEVLGDVVAVVITEMKDLVELETIKLLVGIQV